MKKLLLFKFDKGKSLSAKEIMSKISHLPYPFPSCKLSYKLNARAANPQVYRYKTSGKTLSDK
jgi:hypothetical protein